MLEEIQYAYHIAAVKYLILLMLYDKFKQ